MHGCIQDLMNEVFLRKYSTAKELLILAKKALSEMLDRVLNTLHNKMKFSIKDFFSKCDQIRSFLRIWSYLLKKSLIENFIFCAVIRLLNVRQNCK